MDMQNIDWAATGAMLGGIGSLLGAGAVIFGLLKAKSEVDNWKEQERYKEDRRLAIEIIAAFEEGRQSIREIRSPMSLGGEQAEVEARLNEAVQKEGVTLNDAERSNHLIRLTVLYRIERYKECWDRIAKLLPLAKAVFGERVKQLLFDIPKARHEVSIAANMFRHKLSDESRQKHEATIWQMTTDPKEDPIDSKLHESAEELERLLTPYIKASHEPLATQ